MTDKEMKVKLGEEIKSWLHKRNEQRKRHLLSLKMYLQDYIEVTPGSIPENNRKAFYWHCNGKRVFVKPKRQILLRMGKGLTAKYRFVDVEYKRERS